MANSKPLDERTIFIVITFLMSFLLINFNRELGIIFSVLLFLDFWMYYTDDFVSFKTETRTDNRLASILYSIIGYGIFIGLASVVSTFLGAVSFLGSVLQSMSASVPVLSESKELAIFAWGILIPIIETRIFFGRWFEFVADKWGAVLNKNGLRSLRTWLVMAFVSGTFAVFHLTSKASSGDIGFAATFIFGMVSCAMVIYFQEMKQAIGTHVLSNTIAVLGKYGVLGV
jgi:hypothetical protein